MNILRGLVELARTLDLEVWRVKESVEVLISSIYLFMYVIYLNKTP